GTITAIAGGALLVVAVSIDVAGLSSLNEFRDLSDGNFGDLTPAEARERYDELEPKVETNILLTRIFYSVSAVALATGPGLIIWEILSASPDSLEEETAVRFVPSFSADAAGGTAPGAALHISF